MRREELKSNAVATQVSTSWEQLRAVLDSFPEATNAYDREWRFIYINHASGTLIREHGKDPHALIGRVIWEEFPGLIGTRFEREARRAVADDEVVEFEAHLLSIDRWLSTRIVPIPGGVITYSWDITRQQHHELAAAVCTHITKSGTLRQTLQPAAELVVRYLDAAFARVWSLDERTQTLVLQASAGMYTNLDGPHSRIPVGALKIGEIAQERRPHLTNHVVHDPRVSDPDWARREGIVSFAGYPLVADDRLVGVLGLFAKHRLSDATIQALASVATCLAIAIQRATVEITLRDEELRYRALAESAAQFVWMTDAEGRPSGPLGIATWRRLTGQTADDFDGQGWLGAIHPDDRPHVAERWTHALTTYTPVDVIYRLRLADGIYRRYRVRGIPIRNEHGKAREWIGVGADVEEDLRAEERRELLERSSRVLAESLDVGTTLESIAQLVVPDLADICLAYLGSSHAGLSRAATAAADPAKAEIARALQDLPPIDVTRLAPEFRAVRAGRSVFIPELTDRTLMNFAAGPEHLRLIRALEPRSGLAVPLMARGQLLGALLFLMADSGRRFGPDDLGVAEELGRRTGLAVVNAQLFDESEWARAEAVAANQAKSQFLATMSHELRTPLNAISGYASLIEDGVYGPVTDRQRDALERLRRSQHHLLRLVEGVLDYARIEAHVVSYEITDVSLGDALASADALVAPQLGAKGIDFTCDFRACNHVVRADAEKLGQILLNLLSNAIKFTARGGHILVRCELREDDVAIQVTDTGIGIPAEHSEAIFQPFVQVRGGLTRTTEGAGLGLPISRDLARGMGGDLTVQSVVGQGSTFTLTLPRARMAGD